ncbi:MAG: PilZ domain-containing protein [Candidatus Omnitrophica bacterium]|nr:PilZ domain-containing protein [Candidatus Omnitrophota bacterium]
MELTKKNKRRYLRIKAYHLLKYRLIEKGKKEVDISFAKNLGAGGVFFRSPEKIPKGAKIELKINVPPYPKPINTIAKVLRVKPLKKKKEFDVAAEFVNIEESAQLFIQEKIAVAEEKRKKDKLRKIVIFLTIILGLIISGVFLMLVIKGKGWF